MSGCSSDTNCPNCQMPCDLYEDWKPFSYSSITCLRCGLVIQPKLDYMDLEELNYNREEQDLEPLTELPEQDRSIY